MAQVLEPQDSIGPEPAINSDLTPPSYDTDSFPIARDSSPPAQIESNQVGDNEARTSDLVPEGYDVVDSIKGMYRILDLVSEQGSGGLVEKIIISQESLGHFINDICPGAYRSMTKVDFTALDRLTVKPMGIYGSRSEIVRYLYDVGVVDDGTVAILRSSEDGDRNSLRTGIYILRPSHCSISSVIFWPEDTTWNDEAAPSVQRNRVTFMRYLTKICTQVFALISDEDASMIVWREVIQQHNSEDEAENIDLDIDDVDRFFSFKVIQTNEQEENVVVRPGFTVSLPQSNNLRYNEYVDVEFDHMRPRLVAGETEAGYLDVKYASSLQKCQTFPEKYNAIRLRSFLEKDAFILSSDLQEDALQILLRHGLGAKRSPRVIQAFHESRQLLQDEYERRKQKAWEETNNTWHSLLPQAIRHELARTVLSNYSSRVQNAVYDRLSQEQVSELQAVVHGLFVSCPDVPARILQASNDLSFSKITSNPYEIKKQGLLKIMHTITGTRTDHWTQQELQELARNVWEPQKHYMSLRSVVNGWWATLSSTPEQRSAYASSSHSEYDEGMLTDAECLSRLETFFSNFRIFDADVEEIFLLAAGYLKDALERQITEVMHYLDQLRSKAFRKVLENIEADHCNQNIESRRRFLADVRHSYLTDSKTIRIIENVRIIENGRRQVCYEISGYLKRCIDESLVYRVFPFKVSEQDMQEMQMSADFIPSPRLHPRSSFSFCTPVTDKVVFIQLLQDDRCLLVIESNESLNIYLERMDAIGKALENRMPKRTLRMERINCDYLLAFNESKRILALCTTNKSLLHFFVFDERFMSCSGLGPRVTLTLWYLESDTHSLLTHAAFLCGPNEEALALVDDGGSVRVFSLITQQFRPSSVTLPQPAIGLYSSPDGSCLFVACANSNKISLRAYHSSTFGHTEGIHLEIPGLPISSPIMTSIGNRSKTYYVGLDDEARCISFALDITSRPAEFSFRERQKSYPLSSTYRKTLRNSLLDCHADVWTRFPVLSAIRRSTSNTMSFVSTLDPTQIQNYIKDSILNFQRITKKPTGRELSEMVICGMPYEAFRVSKNNDLSIYKLGQWLVNLLCLIPIHIAVAWENRFVPLKDGVWSRGFEESLLGATVEQIVDNLSFGWYESILKSYMSSKPVRVVSSMGEQSVGKSFTLNHLVDTSFAGSAMRTTEGVWMSLTPTDDALIVALDFEGVHSLERSIQEDSLLVLFNTALSNLVLFRNNFALSRSITDLFHSFQSSSTVLDTAANPTLFRSTLAIIIKDVIQSDKEEIKKEFSLRFQSIVDTEKESNFITKLHNGNVLIIPWPVIESREFYGMFRPLGKMLEEQDVTHPKGAMFLETMKTLMAKLKANDWGALNQNIALHRAQQLVLSLPTAFAYGVVELEPEIEPLRDLDSGNVIETFDTSAKFYVTGTRVNSEDQEHVLIYLLSSSGHFDQRYDQDEHHWVTGLQKYLDDLVEARIAHVQEWMNTNMSRFQPEVESSLFEEVRRLFADLSISLHATIKICASQCSSCQLFCLRPMHHEGSHSCNTDHKCPRFCEYAVDHDGESVQCGLPAGHRGTHICDFSTHRCGKDCYLSGKDGCLHFCAKSVDHADGDHDCLEPHECGKPCILANVRLADGSLFTCRYTCRKLSHVSHEEHVCDDHNCPISCQLCKRLCASSSHLHALDKNAIHLCGQEHPCLESCQSPGLCLIETTPESIEAIFTGRYETFQYTKYIQISRRLPCAIVILPGQLNHEGVHIHNVERKQFHFCESKCGDCGYFCTLPIGHRQQEHETSHGSMSRTQWAIDDQDGSGLEIDGRRFGANDDGSPMLCSMVCRDRGRHVHVDYCRSEDSSACSDGELQHITHPISPNPERAKDFVSHRLYWRRTGFKDPYSQEERIYYSKCDSICPGPEHNSGTGAPSYCTLSIFHHPLADGHIVPGQTGYISSDGHHFICRKPVSEAYNIFFVIDRSSSMGKIDRHPLPNTPVTHRISARHNNRVGSVYSSLYGFWTARQHVLNETTGRARFERDVYTIIFFDQQTIEPVTNDSTRAPTELLHEVLKHGPGRGTNFTAGIERTQEAMTSSWSNERTPVVIFLSDGEGSISNDTMRDLCNRAVSLGCPLSFHAVSFGPSNTTLRRMASVASEVQNAASSDPTRPTVPSSYIEAADTVRLAETLLGLAESLRKTRGALIRG